MISVVIPAFNAGRFIRRTIDSVLAQTYCDYEIIVVDDGSTDDTPEVVKSYGQKVRYIYQENAGDGPARNTGIAAAKGEWIAFLDHDDEWLPQKLQLQMELLRQNPELRWCAANYYMSSGSRRAVVGNCKALCKAMGNSSHFEDFFLAVAKMGCSLVTATVVVRKDVFQKAGFFDSCWLGCADLDMWWRIAHHYPKIGYLPLPLAIRHLDVQTGLSKQIALRDKSARDRLQLVACHLELAGKFGSINEFRPLAAQFLRQKLRSTLFYGLRDDAREIIAKFPDLLVWYVRYAGILLTVFPRLTSGIMRTISYLRRLLGWKRQLTRPHSRAEVVSALKEDKV